MKNPFLLLAATAVPLALAACGEDKPPAVVHETRVVHHYHTERRQSAPSNNNNPDNFEPVERPASYSR